MTIAKLVCLTAALSMLAAAPAAAQQRPLVTEDPETIGAGLILLEGGLDYLREQIYPASGLEGNLFRAPVIGISLGVSSIAEIQIDGPLYNRLTITDRRDAPLAHLVTATAVGDFVVATKVRLLSEAQGRPAIGVRFATKLPNANNESGLGLDTTDFHIVALAGKTIQSIRVVGNLGIGILDDPTQIGRQNEVWLYGVSLARAVAEGLEVVGEINGRADEGAGTPPPGTEGGAVMRLGGRYTRGTARVDAGLLLGMTSRDPKVGFTVGLTYVFEGFSVP
jgi:hypothetical protein